MYIHGRAPEDRVLGSQIFFLHQHISITLPSFFASCFFPFGSGFPSSFSPIVYVLQGKYSCRRFPTFSTSFRFHHALTTRRALLDLLLSLYALYTSFNSLSFRHFSSSAPLDLSRHRSNQVLVALNPLLGSLMISLSLVT
jgi:hypothetical protein